MFKIVVNSYEVTRIVLFTFQPRVFQNISRRTANVCVVVDASKFLIVFLNQLSEHLLVTGSFFVILNLQFSLKIFWS